MLIQHPPMTFSSSRACNRSAQPVRLPDGVGALADTPHVRRRDLYELLRRAGTPLHAPAGHLSRARGAGRIMRPIRPAGRAPSYGTDTSTCPPPGGFLPGVINVTRAHTVVT